MLIMFKSVSELQAVLLQKINREIQMGRVAGPYTNLLLPNLHCAVLRSVSCLNECQVDFV